MGGQKQAFKLESKNYIETNVDNFNKIWGVNPHNVKDAAKRTITENQDTAIDTWGLYEDAEEQDTIFRTKVAEGTALITDELRTREEQELEALAVKAKKKNWDDDKLHEKQDAVRQKYHKLWEKKVHLLEKQAQRAALKKSNHVHNKLEEKVDIIDRMVKEREEEDERLRSEGNEIEVGDRQIEKDLMKVHYECYKKEDENKPEYKKDKDAFFLYSTNDGYTAINTVLRNDHAEHKVIPKTKRHGEMNTKDATEVMINAAKKEQLRKDTLLFRNSNLFGLKCFLGLFDEKIENSEDLFRFLEKEQSINGFFGSDSAFMSTTLDTHGTGVFKTDQVEYRILAPKGTKGNYITAFSQYQEENEYLLQAGTIFRVLKIGTEGMWNPEKHYATKGKNVPPDAKIIVYMEAIQKKDKEVGA